MSVFDYMVDNRIDVFTNGKIGTHRFLRTAHQAIGGIDVEFENIGYVGGNAAARKPADVWQRIRQAGKAV